MKSFFLIGLLFWFSGSEAQVSKVSLQASGLTCSMCSKAVLNALQKVSFVNKVQVDIKSQQYTITFKDSSSIELDALAQAVEDAGFSVAKLIVTANVQPLTLGKDEHVKIGTSWFHFLNASSQQVNGEMKFTLVDKKFTSAKEAKKYLSMSKMECVQTGKAASCCTKDSSSERIYHAII
jgi:copper chaperone CopZ